MKYVYTNITGTIQSVLLASKKQDSVNMRTFTPGATLELDYPGLNLYVPNILSCVIIDVKHHVVPEPIVVPPIPAPIVVPEPVVVPLPVPAPIVVPEPAPIVSPTHEPIPVPEPTPFPIVEPIIEQPLPDKLDSSAEVIDDSVPSPAKSTRKTKK